MNRYFIYDNANRKIKTGKFTFLFDVVESVGGAWRGVLKLAEADEVAALLALPVTLGIREITELEYNEQLKKKTPSGRKVQPQLIRTPQFQEGEKAAAVVVGAPGARPTKGEHENKEPAKAPLDKVLKIGKAPFVDPLEIKPASKKKQKVS